MSMLLTMPVHSTGTVQKDISAVLVVNNRLLSGRYIEPSELVPFFNTLAEQVDTISHHGAVNVMPAYSISVDSWQTIR